MKKTIYAIVICFFVIIANYSYAYSDISKDFWGYNAIMELSDRNILSGYPDGTFRPEEKMTIAEFITVLMKVIEPNADVSSASEYWADSSIKLAEEKNILCRDDYSNFNPDSFITRREICLMIYRSLGGEENIALDSKKGRKEFIDIDSSNLEEKTITSVLSEFGVINGYPDGTIRLNNTSSRAETCAFVDSYLKKKCEILAVINENKFVKYENDIAMARKDELPFTLKKWKNTQDIPYVTTEIREIDMFSFDNPPEKYKSVFEKINNSEEIYLQYRKKFGEGNFVIAVDFCTTNNTYDYEAYSGHEFLRLRFPEEQITIVDAFDTDEIKRQLAGNGNVGEMIMPSQTRDTSAFYVVNMLPQNKIRFDRDITGLYKIDEGYNGSLRSYNSIIVNLES